MKAIKIPLVLFSMCFLIGHSSFAKRIRTALERGTTNRAIETANKDATGLVGLASKGVETTDLTNVLDTSRMSANDGAAPKLTESDLAREDKAIEIYQKADGEMSGHLARVLLKNRNVPAAQGLDLEGWENFVSAAEQWGKMLIRTEKALEQILESKGLNVEEVRGCAI